MSLSNLSGLTMRANMHPMLNRSYYRNSGTAVMVAGPRGWKCNRAERRQQDILMATVQPGSIAMMSCIFFRQILCSIMTLSMPLA